MQNIMTGCLPTVAASDIPASWVEKELRRESSGVLAVDNLKPGVAETVAALITGKECPDEVNPFSFLLVDHVRPFGYPGREPANLGRTHSRLGHYDRWRGIICGPGLRELCNPCRRAGVLRVARRASN